MIERYFQLFEEKHGQSCSDAGMMRRINRAGQELQLLDKADGVVYAALSLDGVLEGRNGWGPSERHEGAGAIHHFDQISGLYLLSDMTIADL